MARIALVCVSIAMTRVLKQISSVGCFVEVSLFCLIHDLVMLRDQFVCKCCTARVYMYVDLRFQPNHALCLA